MDYLRPTHLCPVALLGNPWDMGAASEHLARCGSQNTHESVTCCHGFMIWYTTGTAFELIIYASQTHWIQQQQGNAGRAENYAFYSLSYVDMVFRCQILPLIFCLLVVIFLLFVCLFVLFMCVCVHFLFFFFGFRVFLWGRGWRREWG